MPVKRDEVRIFSYLGRMKLNTCKNNLAKFVNKLVKTEHRLAKFVCRLAMERTQNLQGYRYKGFFTHFSTNLTIYLHAKIMGRVFRKHPLKAMLAGAEWQSHACRS